jgi:hypothetical protein
MLTLGMTIPDNTGEFKSRSWRGVVDTTLCDKCFVSDLFQIGGFLQVLQFPPSKKLTVTI